MRTPPDTRPSSASRVYGSTIPTGSAPVVEVDPDDVTVVPGRGVVVVPRPPPGGKAVSSVPVSVVVSDEPIASVSVVSGPESSGKVEARADSVPLPLDSAGGAFSFRQPGPQRQIRSTVVHARKRKDRLVLDFGVGFLMISSFKIGRPGFPLYENPGVVFMLFLPADAAVPQGKAGLVDIRWTAR